MLNAKIPPGHLSEKWDNYKKNAKLVSPNNRNKLKIIVIFKFKFDLLK